MSAQKTCVTDKESIHIKAIKYLSLMANLV